MKRATNRESLRGRLRSTADPEERLSLLFNRLVSTGGENPRAALKLADEAYNLAVSAGLQQQTVRALYERSRLLLSLGDPRNAMSSISDALAICGPAHAAILTAARAEVYSQLGDYVKSLEFLFQAVELAEEHGRTADLPMLLAGIAGIYYSTGDYQRSIDYLLRSLELCGTGSQTAHNGKASNGSTDSSEEGIEDASGGTPRENAWERQRAIILCNIGNAYGNLPKSRREEMHYYRQALAAYRRIGDRRGESSVLGNIGVACAMRGDFPKALEHQTQALAICRELEQEGGTAMLLSQLGQTYQLMGDHQASLRYLNEALAMLERLEERRHIHEIHRMLSASYEGTGDLARAFEHQKLYLAMREEILNQEKQRRIAEMRMRIDIEKAEREKEELMLHARQLEEKLALKNRQLAATALRLVENNELLDTLQKQMGELLEASGGNKGAARALIRKIQGSRRPEGAWEQFRKEFEGVHPDFMRTLSQRFPSLTPTELKICALLKINLGTKDIAHLLCIAPRSVDMNRYRIRKKLELASETNLTSFLAGF